MGDSGKSGFRAWASLAGMEDLKSLLIFPSRALQRGHSSLSKPSAGL